MVILNPLQTMTDTEKNGGEKTESKYKIKWILIFIEFLSACALLGYVILNRTSERPAAEVSVEQRASSTGSTEDGTSFIT